MLLLCCWPVRKKLLFIRHLDPKGELEQKKSHPSSSNPGFALGLVPECSYQEAFHACLLLEFAASKYQRLFRLILKSASWQNSSVCWFQAPFYMKCRGGKHRPLSKLAEKGRPVFFNPRAEFGVDKFFEQKHTLSSAGESQTMSGTSHCLPSLLCRSKREGRQIPCLPSCRLVMKWWTSTRWSWAAPEERPSPWWKAPTRSWSLSSAGRQEPQSFPAFLLPHRPPRYATHFSSWRPMAWPNLSTSLVLSTQAWAQGQMLVLSANISGTPLSLLCPSLWNSHFSCTAPLPHDISGSLFSDVQAVPSSSHVPGARCQRVTILYIVLSSFAACCHCCCGSRKISTGLIKIWSCLVFCRWVIEDFESKMFGSGICVVYFF